MSQSVKSSKMSTRQSSLSTQPSIPSVSQISEEDGQLLLQTEVTSNSPEYVSVSTDGSPTGRSNRSYVSLTSLNPNPSSSDGDEQLDSNTTYVYVDGSTEHALFAPGDGGVSNEENITYPVFSVGEAGAAVTNSSGSAHFFASTTHAGVTYAQEGGVTFLVSATASNNNSNESSNANLEDVAQTNISHATRVSPATAKILESSGKIDGVDIENVIWVDEYEEAAFLNSEKALDSSLGIIDEDIEDIVLMISKADISRISENQTTAFPSSEVLASLKSCPVTVQWLLDNYETAEGVSLPRSTLYYHYMRHCSDHKLDPVNAASFGKLIRSVFLGLRTRRLGTRGNSKYHYYGIRLKPDSPLNAIDEKMIDEIMNGKNTISGNTNGSMIHPSQRFSAMAHSGGFSSVSPKRARISNKVVDQAELLNGLSSPDSSLFINLLGDTTQVVENLPDITLDIKLSEGLVQDDLVIFHTLYRELCSQLLEDISNFNLAGFQTRWRVFFRSEVSPSHMLEQQEYENLLSKEKLMSLCSIPEIQDYMRRTDYQLYQSFSVILLPDVLRIIPSSMTQAIRNFSKVVEGCLSSAMSGYPEELISIKLSVVTSFSQTLRRYTSLNHLAQAARQVLQNEAQINQMLSDLNRVDFHHVEEQATWVCGCNGDLVPDLESDFKAALSNHQSLEDWAVWLESVVDRILHPYENTEKYSSVARYFLLKWSFYSSMVIRDLTLRSAASFGSFHLLRLLYDEYIFYLVENRVAQATNTFPIAVMGQKTKSPLDKSENNEESLRGVDKSRDEEPQEESMSNSPSSYTSSTNGPPSNSVDPTQVILTSSSKTSFVGRNIKKEMKNIS